MIDPVIEKVENFVLTLLPPMGLELVEVQFRREQHGWVLRVFIDASDGGGVTLDHCSQVSRELGDYLDVEDCIEHQYNLEISSPGLERKLAKIEDFVRFTGKKAKIKFHQSYDDSKVHIGIISQVEEGTVMLQTEDGDQIAFSLDMISSARLAL